MTTFDPQLGGRPPASPPTTKIRPGPGAAWWWFVALMTLVLTAIAIVVPRYAMRALLLSAIVIVASLAAYGTSRLLDRIPSEPRPIVNPTESTPTWLNRSNELPLVVQGWQSPNPAQPLTTAAQEQILFIATERLWERHRVNPHNAADRDKVRRLVSPPLFATLYRDPNAMQPTGAHLTPILEELENL